MWSNDPLLKLGAYLQVNPDLCKSNNNNLFEIDRMRVTRYKVGSHNLKIETGRMCNPVLPREDRLCLCKKYD